MNSMDLKSCTTRAAIQQAQAGQVAKVEALREEALKIWPSLSSILDHWYDHIDPKILAYLEPRRIQTAGGFHSIRQVAAGMFGLLVENELSYEQGTWGAVPAVAPTQVTAQGICYDVINNGVQTYYVAEEFARAVAATELPQDLIIDELNWPLPAMVLAFPPKFMKEYLGIETCYVYCARQDKGILSCPKANWAPPIEIPRDRVAWWFFSYHQGFPQSYVSSFWRDSLASGVLTDYVYTDYSGMDAVSGVDGKAMTDRMSLLILKLIGVLNWSDGAVVKSSLTRPLSVKKGVERPALWSPNIIGSNFKMQSQVGASQPGQTNVRPHIRRGHSAYQVIGKKAELVSVDVMPRTGDGHIDWDKTDALTKAAFWRTHKRIWIAPICVNFQD